MANNNALAFLKRQYGYLNRINSDVAVKRFTCAKKDSFNQLLNPEDDDGFYQDTPIFACKFSPQENNEQCVALANEDGKLAIHNCDTSNRYGIVAHNNAIFDLAWMFDQMKLVTASGDHTSKMYDVGDGELREERVFCGHTRSVKTIAFRKDDPSVFSTGGRDGNIILWDTRADSSSFVGKADKTIVSSHTAKNFTPSKSKRKFSTPTNSAAKSVTGLVFQDCNTLISCGAGDGVIKIWDIRKNYTVHRREVLPKVIIPYSGSTTRNGYSSLIIDSSGSKLYANCLDNTIYCYNLNSYDADPIMKYTGHMNNTFYVKSSLSKNGDYLISGSSDESAYIWNTNHSLPLVKLTGHTAEVTCVAWCSKNLSVVTCSDDMTHKFWTVGPEELPEGWENIGRGQAEVLPLNLNFKYAKNTLKRSLNEEIRGSNTFKKFLVECYKCDGPTTSIYGSCEKCSLKRKNTEELSRENKRVATPFGPKRLFSLAKIPELPGCSNDFLALRLEDNNDNLEESQMKIRKLEDDKDVLTNLPNYVLDGTAPHLNYSPPKKKRHDWLTRIRIEKNLYREMRDKIAEPSPPKMPKFEVSQKCRKTPEPKSPLLRFFKVTNSAGKCDGSSCSKSHGCSNYMSPNLQMSQ